jgi:Protein of unknown function (DUF4038)/Putative collagen-binding domain of a collagenase
MNSSPEGVKEFSASRVRNPIVKWLKLLSLISMTASLGVTLVRAEAAPGPIRVSQNGRYFVDAQGKPFYFLADTQWELFRRYSLSEAKLILENRKAKGFTVVMVMLTGVGDGTGPNLEGQHPWLNDDPATPNPDYFTNMDVDLTKISGARSEAEWIDPIAGQRQPLGNFPTKGTQSFARPAGWQDAILVVKAVDNHARGVAEPAVVALPPAIPARGPLRVCPANPRYFTDGSGKAMLLTGSHTWGNLQDYQYHRIRFIKQYEATKSKQHPVGMTATWPGGEDALLASPADWISPAAKLPVADGRKVILNDTDHSYFWIGLKHDGLAAQRAWVWENFTRGSQCLFMDPYLDPSHDPGRNNPIGGQPDAYWETLRKTMGLTRRLAERMNLAALAPHAELASTGYCLANPGAEYLIYQPKDGEAFTVKLKAGAYHYEWLDAVKGAASETGRIDAVAVPQSFKAPFKGDAVLYLKPIQP